MAQFARNRAGKLWLNHPQKRNCNDGRQTVLSFGPQDYTEAQEDLGHWVFFVCRYPLSIPKLHEGLTFSDPIHPIKERKQNCRLGSWIVVTDQRCGPSSAFISEAAMDQSHQSLSLQPLFSSELLALFSCCFILLINSAKLPKWSKLPTFW
jgi:hypothetical protein